jgi:heme exporter protein A
MAGDSGAATGYTLGGMTFALDIEDLALVRGHRRLFAGLSVSLRTGDFLSLEGANGAGKTSLLRVIAGLLAPTAGIVRIRTEAGDLVLGEDRALAVGWLGDRDAIKPQLTVGEQLRFWARLYGVRPPACEAFGLKPDIPGQFLSAGQKRRLGLARLTVTGRKLWLMDEPLSALDAAGKALVAEKVTAHCASGGIAIAATHEPIGLEAKTLRLGDT